MSHAAGIGRSAMTRVRVRYAETDRMGVVYYANYFVWFEVGRTEWLRDAGWSYREMEAAGLVLPVIQAHGEYRQPARYDDELEVTTRAWLLSPVRVRFDYEVRRAGEEAPLAVGHTVHATLDRAGRPCRVPERVRAILGRRLKSDGSTAAGGRLASTIED